MPKNQKSKPEEFPMPAIEAHKKRQDRLSDELLDGFTDLKAFLKWKHELIHACLGKHESIQKVITIPPYFRSKPKAFCRSVMRGLRQTGRTPP